MFVKTLTLKGFKSFADKTTLNFEPGVTVIVGPNGSGKSNVVDAVAWVLGAQGPSSLRGGKMDDVIFAGSGGRPALGRAEVSLTIDNTSGVLPIDFSEVEITRTLFRSGDSEYAINGVPCRLLDIQELLSDSGVGRHQHVIVGQGQVDAVLNARPEARRAIVEEAAGILKYRKRKEKAERRLETTEGSMLRLQDLLREVKRQLRPLERQADAARRHGQVEAELKGIRLHLLGRQIAQLEGKVSGSRDERRTMSLRDREIRDRLAGLDASVLAVEETLAGLRDERLDDAMVRAEALRERTRGIAALLAEKRAGLERARQAAADESVVESLRAEASSLRVQLGEVEATRAEVEPLRAEVESARRRAEAAREAQEQASAAEASDREATLAEARGEQRALEQGLAQARRELERTATALETATARHQALLDEVAGLHRTADEVAVLEPDLQERLAETRRLLAERETALSAAEEARRTADAEVNRWKARAEALALALDAARAEAGADRIEGLQGVVGPLVEHIEIEEGAEAAVAAALGEAMRALVVEDAAAARQAIERLTEGDVHALLVVLEGADRAAQGRLAPPGARPLADCVAAKHPGLGAVIETLLEGTVLVETGWREALELALEHPLLTVTTPAGERFRLGGTWRAGAAADEGVTKAALEEALRRADEAEVAQRAAESALIDARRAHEGVFVEERRFAKEFDACQARRVATDEARRRVESDLARAAEELSALVTSREELAGRVERDAQRLDTLAAQVAALAEVEEEVRRRRETLDTARQEADAAAEELTRLRGELARREAAVEERRAVLQARLAEVEQRLDRAGETSGEAAARMADLEHRATALARLERAVRSQAEMVSALHDRFDEARRARHEARREASGRLEELRRERAGLERELEELRERLSRLEIDDAEAKMRLEAAVDTVRREFDCEPEVAVAAPAPAIPEGTTLGARGRELERELRLMGPINPLALEEYEALRERSVFLEEQLEDVKQTRRELQKVIRAVDVEITSVFTQAFADVERHFADLFARLFPGGQGGLKLTEPDDMLATGIEIEAKPSGKNVRRLSLLSGGERSLVAMAFLFAVFRARPSPFYLLDEVEAALDDVNLHRFIELIEEFRDEAQLVIVSHQKRTMEAADLLYGISMPPGGSSKAVSEKLRDRQQELTLP
ncbi:MAG TPA: chromosome segregation protein SMC [Acidimicrobiia bacterium]|nr:chromosome segregation protein SMC [Acidimicrobiia bacterium]